MALLAAFPSLPLPTPYMSLSVLSLARASALSLSRSRALFQLSLPYPMLSRDSPPRAVALLHLRPVIFSYFCEEYIIKCILLLHEIKYKLNTSKNIRLNAVLCFYIK
jgi:hypothetical protein